jgi:hypothetical protein
VDGVVEQCDAASENTAENFGNYEAECCGHGPAEDGRFQGGVRVAGVSVAVMGVAVHVSVNVVLMGM